MKRLVILALVLAGCGGSTQTASCSGVENGVLPAWARGGFSDAKPRIAHVMGTNGSITAILFKPRLTGGAKEKILWVSRFPVSGPQDLHITATNGSQTIRRVVPGGPGPSGIELPSGCWRLQLRWGGHTDSLSLRYV